MLALNWAPSSSAVSTCNCCSPATVAGGHTRALSTASTEAKGSPEDALGEPAGHCGDNAAAAPLGHHSDTANICMPFSLDTACWRLLLNSVQRVQLAADWPRWTLDTGVWSWQFRVWRRAEEAEGGEGAAVADAQVAALATVATAAQTLATVVPKSERANCAFQCQSGPPVCLQCSAAQARS